MGLLYGVYPLPDSPPYFAVRRLDKKRLPVVAVEVEAGVELSTLLIAMLHTSIVLARSVILFRTSGPNSLGPVSPRSSLQISLMKELSFGRDLEMLLIIAMRLA
jgi:hypothetical protein